MTDFKEATDKHEFNSQHNNNHSMQLHFEQAELLMRELGFANDQQSNKKEIQELWKTMKGEEHGGQVHLMTLKIFLAAIMNFNMEWMKLKNDHVHEQEH